jgi:flagellar basal-body rod protein FlgB
MAMSFDKSLGISQHALLIRERRSEILAANLANADTPNYKARDIDFQAMLKGAVAQRDALPMRTTQAGHIKVKTAAEGELMYRNPYQANIDDNTVDAAEEQARFAKNSVEYLTSLRMLNDKFSGLKTALRGE